MFTSTTAEQQHERQSQNARCGTGSDGGGGGELAGTGGGCGGSAVGDGGGGGSRSDGGASAAVDEDYVSGNSSACAASDGLFWPGVVVVGASVTCGRLTTHYIRASGTQAP